MTRKFLALAAATAGATTIGVLSLAVPIRGQSVVVRADEGGPRRIRAVEVLGGTGAEIGVTIRDTDAGGAAAGAVVDEVKEGGPAAKAGVRAGDVFVSFDGERIRSARQFARLVEETAPGRQTPATVLREGKSVDVKIAPDRSSGLALLGPRRWEMGDLPKVPAPGYRFEVPELGDLPDRDELAQELRRGLQGLDSLDRGPRLGVGVLEITPELAQHLGAKGGVMVNSVTPDSAAARAGVKVGDVIASVDGTPVDDATDLRRAVRHGEQPKDVSLGIVRDKKDVTVKVPLDAPRKTAPEPPKRPI